MNCNQDKIIVKQAPQNGKAYHLTDVEVQTILDNYLVVPSSKLARMMGLPEGVISRRIKKWGLIIPPQIKEKWKTDSRFSVGHVPMNKGKKQSEYMSVEVIARTAATRFKKGHKPGNTTDVLTISVRRDNRGIAYQWIKISDRNWEMLHIFNWHKENGDVPVGRIIVFKNGDTMNCSPDNLEAITRAENLARNSELYKNMNPELRKTIKLIKKVSKEINNQ